MRREEEDVSGTATGEQVCFHNLRGRQSTWQYYCGMISSFLTQLVGI